MTEDLRKRCLQFAADGHGHALGYAYADKLIAEGLIDKDKRLTDSGRAELRRLMRAA